MAKLFAFTNFTVKIIPRTCLLKSERLCHGMYGIKKLIQLEKVYCHVFFVYHQTVLFLAFNVYCVFSVYLDILSEREAMVSWCGTLQNFTVSIAPGHVVFTPGFDSS